jgi:hypothetical protein
MTYCLDRFNSLVVKMLFLHSRICCKIAKCPFHERHRRRTKSIFFTLSAVTKLVGHSSAVSADQYSHLGTSKIMQSEIQTTLGACEQQKFFSKHCD